MSQDRRTFLQQVAGGMAALALTPELLPAAPRAGRNALKLGVIGVGKRGRDALTELAKIEAIQVAALCDIKELSLRRAGRRAPDAQTFPDHGAMLDGMKDLQAVVIATPTHSHKQIVLDCLAAGKHVYCEAPIAANLDDARAIAEAGSRASTVFQVGHTARCNPVYKLARSFVRSGTLRDLLQIRVQSNQKSSWRAMSSNPEHDRVVNWRLYKDLSAGLPGELTSHQMDAVHWFINKLPVRVSGRGRSLAYDDGRENPDTVECDFDFENKVRMQASATLGNSFERDYEQYSGTMGTIKMASTHGWLFKEADAPVQGWEVYASRQKFHNEVGITLIADATKLAAQGADLESGIGLPNPPLYYGMETFAKSILEGADVKCTAADGLRAAAISIRAHEAVLAGDARDIESDILELS